MKFKFHIESRFFNQIASHKKTLEARLNKVTRTFIIVNDTLIFQDRDSGMTMECIVDEIQHYKSLEEMLKNVSKSDLGFDDLPDNEVIETYRKFYTQDEINRLGIVVFKIHRS